MLEHEEITGRIIGSAIEVHRRLGPGFLESVYEKALSIELGKRQLRFFCQPEFVISYDGHPVGKHRLDLLVEETIVVELKATDRIDDIHFAVVRSYLKAARKEHGLILNFSHPRLEIRRVFER